MILLNTTTKSLEIKLAGAVSTTELPFATSYSDISTSTFAISAIAENDGTSNGSTAVTVAAAPGASITRKVGLLTVYNADTAAATVTVQINNNGTLRILCKVALAIASTLQYTDGEGFKVIKSDGSIIVTTASANPGGSNTQVQFNNASTFDGSPNLTWVSPALSIGAQSNATGILKFLGTTSGTVSITPAAAAGTWTFTLPTTAGNANEFIQTNGSGTAIWTNTFTSPKIVTSLLDTNSNILVNISATGSAVNYPKITNAATGTAGPIIAADGETNVDLQLAAKGTGAVHVTTGSYGDITADADGATITFNLATSNFHSVTLGGNRTLALSNAHVGQRFIIRLLQDGTGTRTVTWFTTIKWAGGSAPTLTTTASKADMFGFVVTSAGNYDGVIIGANI